MALFSSAATLCLLKCRLRGKRLTSWAFAFRRSSCNRRISLDGSRSSSWWTSTTANSDADISIVQVQTKAYFWSHMKTIIVALLLTTCALAQQTANEKAAWQGEENYWQHIK